MNVPAGRPDKFCDVDPLLQTIEYGVVPPDAFNVILPVDCPKQFTAVAEDEAVKAAKG